jgi:hypothetical protein
MSNITIATIRRNTIFLNEEDLKKALERTGLRYHILQNGDIEINDILTLQKTTQGYTAIFKVEMRYTQLTSKGRQTEMKVMSTLSNIESAYRNIVEERVERIKYEESRLQEMTSEEERKKKEILLKRERMKIERLRKKEEDMKRKSIEEKIEKLRTKAKSMGYEVQEEVRENERVLVLVRRR